MNEIKSTDFAEMYAQLGIDTGKLGCIMIDTEPLVNSDIIPEEDYYYSEDQKWVQGNVSEEVPHVTLLYGLLRSGNELKKHIYTVLDGIERSDFSLISLNIGGIKDICPPPTASSLNSQYVNLGV